VSVARPLQQENSYISPWQTQQQHSATTPPVESTPSAPLATLWQMPPTLLPPLHSSLFHSQQQQQQVRSS